MIIGISGKAGAGKDALATYLLEFMPGFERRKFADKLKQVAQILTGCADQHSAAGKSHWLPSYQMTVGFFQQKLGADCVRNHLHKDAWVIAALADYHKYHRWIFTDVRFPNEAKAIRDRNGMLVRINRSVRPQLCGRNPKHDSETALDGWRDWDFVFDNDGTLAALRRLARDIADAVEVRK